MPDPVVPEDAPDPAVDPAGAEEPPLPERVNIERAVTGAPEQAPVSKPSLTGIGYTLAKGVLYMIAGVILLSALLVGCAERQRFLMLDRAFREAAALTARSVATPEEPAVTAPGDTLAEDTLGSDTVAVAEPSAEELAQLEQTADAMRQMATALQEEREDFREFARGLIDLVLLNVLLPVLTALLGYIFGTRAGGSDDGA
ncbi:MAG TPA: hypothetical protein VD962_10985 [Rubricoccaceae bacterium]|nr:hypothetical protein [Rubricoccaceae bacterium]